MPRSVRGSECRRCFAEETEEQWAEGRDGAEDNDEPELRGGPDHEGGELVGYVAGVGQEAEHDCFCYAGCSWSSGTD